jgi:hypothetical protein
LHNAAALVFVPPALSTFAATTTDQFGEQWIRFIREVKFDRVATYGTQISVQLDTFSMLQVAKQFWKKSVDSPHKMYLDELDFLQQSMFCPEHEMEGTDEDDLVPLPPPSLKARIEFWIPLQCHLISQYQDDSIFFKTQELPSKEESNAIILPSLVRTSYIKSIVMMWSCLPGDAPGSWFGRFIIYGAIDGFCV